MNPVATEYAAAPPAARRRSRPCLTVSRAGHPTSPLLRLRPPVLRRWWTDAAAVAVWATMLICLTDCG